MDSPSSHWISRPLKIDNGIESGLHEEFLMSECLVTRRQCSLAIMGGAVSLMTPAVNGKEYSTTALKEAQDLASLTLTEAASMLQAGRISSTVLVQSCLQRIASDGVKTNAFITVMGEQALAQARV